MSSPCLTSDQGSPLPLCIRSMEIAQLSWLCAPFHVLHKPVLFFSFYFFLLYCTRKLTATSFPKIRLPSPLPKGMPDVKIWAEGIWGRHYALHLRKSGSHLTPKEKNLTFTVPFCSAGYIWMLWNFKIKDTNLYCRIWWWDWMWWDIWRSILRVFIVL